MSRYQSTLLVQQLIQLRTEEGLTQADVAARTGYARATVASWEAGTRVPPIEALSAYAGVFGQVLLIGPPPVPAGYKRCTRCEEVLPLEDFTREKRMRDGRGSRCKGCDADASLASYYRRRGRVA